MNRLVECVPNFSEGRNPETIEALLTAVRSVAGVVLLDRQSDADHNRTVITFIGTPEAVAEAALLAAREALLRIDLRTHRGEHPRVGATDEVPNAMVVECTEKLHAPVVINHSSVSIFVRQIRFAHALRILSEFTNILIRKRKVI